MCTFRGTAKDVDFLHNEKNVSLQNGDKIRGGRHQCIAHVLTVSNGVAFLAIPVVRVGPYFRNKIIN